MPDPIVQKYLDLIKANTTGIKAFYNGFIARVPVSLLPAVMITIEKTEAADMSNVEDEHRISLVLTYIADIRQDLENSALIQVGLSNVLEKLVGRDSDYKLKTSSILYILRHNVNLDTSKNLRTDVGSFSVATPSEIATGRIPGNWSAEGTIRFNAHFYQER